MVGEAAAVRATAQVLEKPAEMLLARWGLKDMFSVSLLTTVLVETVPKAVSGIWHFFFPKDYAVSVPQGKQIIKRLDTVEGDLKGVRTSLDTQFGEVNRRLGAIEKGQGTVIAQTKPASAGVPKGSCKV